MSAEDVKRVLKEYADEHHPGWQVGSAMFRVGDLGDLVPCETLVIVAEDVRPPSPPSGTHPTPARRTVLAVN